MPKQNETSFLHSIHSFIDHRSSIIDHRSSIPFCELKNEVTFLIPYDVFQARQAKERGKDSGVNVCVCDVESLFPFPHLSESRSMFLCPVFRQTLRDVILPMIDGKTSLSIDFGPLSRALWPFNQRMID